MIKLLEGKGEVLEENPNWNPIRKPQPVFRYLDRREQAAFIAKYPAYCRFVCCCETVTEGEILVEISKPILPLTFDAIKR